MQRLFSLFVTRRHIAFVANFDFHVSFEKHKAHRIPISFVEKMPIDGKTRYVEKLNLPHWRELIHRDSILDYLFCVRATITGASIFTGVFPDLVGQKNGPVTTFERKILLPTLRSIWIFFLYFVPLFLIFFFSFIVYSKSW